MSASDKDPPEQPPPVPAASPGADGPPTNGPPPAGPEEMAQKNKRRVELINKEFDKGLTPAEEAELALLQAEMAQYVDALYPLPFAFLDQIKEAARRIGIPVDDLDE